MDSSTPDSIRSTPMLAGNLNEPFLPAPGTKAELYLDRPSKNCIVFLHGIFSDSRECWYQPPAGGKLGVYWPDLLRDDPNYSQYAIFLGGYETAANANSYGVRECAQELYDSLTATKNDAKGGTRVLDSESIIFVCHSTGGIVARELLTWKTSEFASKKIGLLLIASPSYGSWYASLLRPVSWLYRNSLGESLRWGGPEVRRIDQDFLALRDQDRIPRLMGLEAREQHFIFRRRFLPPISKLVSDPSAGRYFPDARTIPGSDHLSIVKPSSRLHPTYRLLTRFLQNFEAEFPPVRHERFGVLHRPSKPFRVQSLNWELDIDKEGDGQNLLTFTGVMPCSKETLFQLPPAEITNGHMTGFELLEDSAGLKLEQKQVDNRKVELGIRLSATGVGASFRCRSYDFNVYPLNTADVSRQPNPQPGNVDYVEKRIDEDVDMFRLTVRFPESMRMTQEPRLEVLANDVVDGMLTARLAPYFFYSRHFHTASLAIPQPPARYSYRILWHLGAPEAVAERDLDFADLDVYRRVQQAMAEVREEYWSPARPESKNSAPMAAIFSSIGDKLADLVSQRTQSKALKINQLDISLLMPDAADRELLVVLAYNPGIPNPYRLGIGYGDGNAGRAWKSRAARRYFHAEAASDPINNTYFRLQGQAEHKFLLSLPIFLKGRVLQFVVNIGCFDEPTAGLLRQLCRENKNEVVVELLNFCQIVMLKKFQDMV